MTFPLERLLTEVSLPDPAPWTQDRAPELGSPKIVVVVPPDGDPARGERLAAIRSSHGRVKLVGRGVTRETLTSDRIVRTEIDCYLPNDKTPILAALNGPVERWLARTFDGALHDVPAVPAMWSSAMMRVLRAHVHAAPLALGLAIGERGHEIVLSEPWVGRPLLEAAVRHTGATLRAPDVRAVPFRLSLAAHALSTGCGAPLRRAVEFARQAPARRRLIALRDALSEPVDTWITVTAHWPHSCRHVIEPLGRAARDRGVRLGVLLQYALEPGELSGGRREVLDRTATFPALAHADLADSVGAVDQIASCETWHELATVSARSMRASARVVWRLLREGSRPSLDGWPVELQGDASALAQLATIDLLRAEEARLATEHLVARRSMRGAAVAFSHASLAQVAVPDQILQRAGARTLDVVHGALAEALDMTTSARTFSTQKLFWTEEEVRYTATLVAPQSCIGGVPSRALPRRARPPANHPLRVLALTNYGTHASDRLRRLPRIAYQNGFFEALEAVQLVAPGASLRWRPHPADNPRAIEETIDAHPELRIERSTTAQLDDDLAWADVVVTSISSTVVEAALLDVPLVVHSIPVHEASVIMAMFDPRRRFHDRASLVAALRDVVTRSPGDSEAALRRRFFGTTGSPLHLADVVFARPSTPHLAATEPR